MQQPAGGGMTETDVKLDAAAVEATLSAPPEFILDLQLAFETPSPRDLLELWGARRNGARLPSRDDFSFDDLRPYFGHLCIVDVLPEIDDLRFKLVGTVIVETVGRDATGMLVSDVLPEPALRIYRYLIQNATPARTHGRVEWRDKEFISHETLLLPLAADGAAVDQFLLMMSFLD